jgi:hypothetical protein
MLRRCASLLLTLAVLLGGTAVAPCAGNASCPMMAARPMDCCAAKTGISKPSCCETKQIRHSPAPVTPDRPVQSSLAAPDARVAPVVLALRSPTRAVVVGRIDAGTAPPGGTLIAQHTSLLL